MNSINCGVVSRNSLPQGGCLKAGLALRVAFLMLAATPVARAVNTWDGGGADDNWGTTNNWDGDVFPTFPAALTFAGTMRLTPVNNLSGITVSGFTFSTNATDAFVISGNAITLGGNIGFQGNPAPAITQAINLDMALSGARTVTSQTDGSIYLGGVISGANNLVKAGAGTLTLAGLNTFSGQIQVNQGTLSVNTIAPAGASSSLGTGNTTPVIRLGNQNQGGLLVYTGSGAATDRQVQIGNGNTTAHVGGAQIFNSGTGAALIFTSATFNAPASATIGRTLTLAGSNTSTNEIRGVIGNNTGVSAVINVAKSEAGTWILSGANTYSGNTTINAGTLRARNSSSFGSAGTVTLANSGALLELGNGVTISRPLTIGNTGNKKTLQLQSGAASATYAGDMTLSETTAANFEVFADAGGTLTVSGAIGASAGVNINKQGDGTVILSGNSSSYNGMVIINAGTLALTGSGSIANASAVSVASNATFDVSGLSSDFALGSAQTLKSAGTVTGAVVVSGIVIPGDLWTAGTLTAQGNMTFQNGSKLAFDLSGSTSSGNDLVDHTAGTLTLPGSGETLTVEFGFLGTPANGSTYTLMQSTSAISGDAASLTLLTNTLYTVSFAIDNASMPKKVTATFNTTGAKALTWDGASGETLWNVAAGSYWKEGAVTDLSFYQGDSVTFDDSGVETNVTIAEIVAPASLTFTNSAQSYILSGSGRISGNTGLTKDQAGTLTLSTANDYTGATAVNGGKVIVGNVAALGTAAGATIVADGAALELKTTGTVAEPVTISGAGVGGTGGALRSTANNTLSGAVTLAADATIESTVTAFTLSGGIALGTGVGAKTLTLNNNLGNAVISTSPITGDGKVIKTGTAYTSFTVSSSYTGGTELQAGNIAVGADDPFGSGTLKLSSGLVRSNINSPGGDRAYTMPLELAGSVTLGSTGQTGIQTFNGGLWTLSGGDHTLTVAAPVVINGVIQDDGTPRSLTKAGVSTLTLTGANTYRGTTIMSGGGATSALILSNATGAAIQGDLQVGNSGDSAGNMYVKLAAPNQFGTNSILFMNKGAGVNSVPVLELLGNNQVVAGITNAGTTYIENTQVETGYGDSVLTVSNALDNSYTSYMRNMSPGGSGTLGLTKDGPAALTLAGSGIFYTGPTLVRNGTLVLSNTTAFGSAATIQNGQLLLATSTALNSKDVTVGVDNGLGFVAASAFTLGGLNGTGAVTLTNDAGAAVALTVGGGNANGSYSGALIGAGSFIKAGSGIQTNSGANTYSGATTVSAGTLVLSGSGSLTNSPAISVDSGATLDVSGMPGGFSLGASQVLKGAGAVLGAASISGTLVPGDEGTAGTLTMSNSVAFQTGSVATFDLSSAATVGGGINDLVEVAGDLAAGGTIRINVIAPLDTSNPYRLFNYTGELTGTFALEVINVADTRYSATLDTDTEGQISVHVSLTSAVKSLTWKGTTGLPNWDLNTSANWDDGVGASLFLTPDAVLFDGTAEVNTANLVGTLIPGTVAVSGSEDVTLSGTGKISGSTGLTKSGSGMLTLSTANDYTGVTTISNGIINAASLSALGSGGDITFSGGVLQYAAAGTNQDWSARFKNSDAPIAIDTAGLASIKYLAGAIDSSNTGGLLKLGLGQLPLSGVNTYAGLTTVSNGELRIAAVNATLGSAAAGTVVENGAALRIEAGTPVTLAENLTLTGNGLGIGGNLAALIMRWNSGTWTLNGAITLESGAVIQTYGAGTMTATISQGIGGSGNLTLAGGAANNGNTIFVLKGQSTYSGDTIVKTYSSQGIRVRNEADNALPVTSVLRMQATSGTTTYGKLLLNGFDQELAGIEGSTGATYTNSIVGGTATLSTLTVSNAADYTYRGLLGNSGTDEDNLALVKQGAGILALTSANTYTGGTAVKGGALLVNNATGSGTGSGAVTVTNATLGGSGAISGNVTVSAGSRLAPGATNTVASTLICGSDLTLAAGVTCAFDGTVLTNDVVAVTGTLTLQGANAVELSLGSLPVPPQVTIFTYGTLVGGANLSSWTVQGVRLGYSSHVLSVDNSRLVVENVVSGSLLLLR